MKVAAFLEGIFVITLWDEVKFSLFVCKITQHKILFFLLKGKSLK